MASAKQQLIVSYIDNNPGTTFNTVVLSQQIGISLPTLLSYIKNNPTKFAKVKHGWYTIESEAPIESSIMGTFTDDGDYIPAPIETTTVLVTVIENADTSDAGPLVYIPNGPIPFPKEAPATNHTSDTDDDDTDVPLVQRVTSRPFDW